MHVTILGSAAGGGFPQWNCACANCSRLRAGKLRSQARSQAQVVVSNDAGACLLINASPDLRSQILSTPLLTPKRTPRDTPISAVLLTSADVDSLVGLVHLREFQPLRIFATSAVRQIALEENRMFQVLDRAKPPAVWQDLPLDTWVPLEASQAAGEESLRCRAIPLSSAYPDYVSEKMRRSLGDGEAVVGLVLAEGKKQIFCAPSMPSNANQPSTANHWKEWAQSSDLCLLDGTFWDENELISAGVGTKTAREIGHTPLSGAGGLLEEFRNGTRGRRVLFHINNTNPVLDEDSAEHGAVRDAGWEIAYDGMEFDL